MPPPTITAVISHGAQEPLSTQRQESLNGPTGNCRPSSVSSAARHNIHNDPSGLARRLPVSSAARQSIYNDRGGIARRVHTPSARGVIILDPVNDPRYILRPALISRQQIRAQREMREIELDTGAVEAVSSARPSARRGRPIEHDPIGDASELGRSFDEVLSLEDSHRILSEALPISQRVSNPNSEEPPRQRRRLNPVAVDESEEEAEMNLDYVQDEEAEEAGMDLEDRSRLFLD